MRPKNVMIFFNLVPLLYMFFFFFNGSFFQTNIFFFRLLLPRRPKFFLLQMLKKTNFENISSEIPVFRKRTSGSPISTNRYVIHRYWIYSNFIYTNGRPRIRMQPGVEHGIFNWMLSIIVVYTKTHGIDQSNLLNNKPLKAGLKINRG